MKGNRKAYKPVSAEREINEVKDVFRGDSENQVESDPLIMTSIRMQEVFEQALKQYIAD